jgi:hypothetical protein
MVPARVCVEGIRQPNVKRGRFQSHTLGDPNEMRTSPIIVCVCKVNARVPSMAAGQNFRGSGTARQ